jgi:hypothetical protein
VVQKASQLIFSRASASVFLCLATSCIRVTCQSTNNKFKPCENNKATATISVRIKLRCHAGKSTKHLTYEIKLPLSSRVSSLANQPKPMKYITNKKSFERLLFFVIFALFPLVGMGQTLNIIDGFQSYVSLTNTTINMSGKC